MVSSVQGSKPGLTLFLGVVNHSRVVILLSIVNMLLMGGEAIS
jgi:hypothetical protein